MPDPFPYGSHAEPEQIYHGVVADDNMLGQDELADVDQGFAPQATPYPKVAAAGAAGTLATLIIGALALAGVEADPALAAALATALAFVAGYLRTE